MFDCLDSVLSPCVLKCLGLAFLAILLIKVVRFFLFMTVAYKKKLKVRKGQWAVVTGASDGIGKQFCLQLAKKGYNICLLSRTKAKLDAVAEECQKEGVDTKVVPVDFSVEPSVYTKILEAEVSPLETDVLVNNVGISFEYPEFYLQTQDNLDERMVNVNIQVFILFFFIFYFFFFHFSFFHSFPPFFSPFSPFFPPHPIVHVEDVPCRPPRYGRAQIRLRHQSLFHRWNHPYPPPLYLLCF